jgi:hypothetical protein
MKITPSQSANKVGSIKPPDGRYKQTGKVTQDEHYRVHFPSRRGEVTTERQVRPSLRASVANREDWELSGKITDQPKIRWVINRFRPFKKAGTDETVPSLLQQEIDHIAAHLCHLVWHESICPKLGDRLRWHFSLNPGRLTTPRLRHIVLLICRPCWRQCKNWWTGT